MTVGVHSATAQQPKKTILIVDDHPVMRLGLTSLIESDTDLTVLGEVASHREALSFLSKVVPDLAIVDLELDGSDGLELIKEMKIRYPKLPAMVLSMHDESLYAERCLRAGAKAYITKQQLDNTILSVIRQLLEGKIYVSKEQEALFTTSFTGVQDSEPSSPLAVLSDRELQVYRLIGQGIGTRDIAQLLFVSHKTIESHREHIKHKLNIDSAAKLLRHATHWVERRLLD